MTSFFVQVFDLPEAPDDGARAESSLTPYWSPDGKKFLLVESRALTHGDVVIERDAGYYLRATGPQVELVDAGIGEDGARQVSARLERAGVAVTQLITADDGATGTRIRHRDSADAALRVAGILDRQFAIEEIKESGWIHVQVFLGREHKRSNE